jgi:hypothetical protein
LAAATKWLAPLANAGFNGGTVGREFTALDHPQQYEKATAF